MILLNKTDSPKNTTDVVIIGSGPVGLFSIFECGMLNLKCHVFEALDCIGGQCTALYPEKPIYDIPSHPTITGEHLITLLKEQAKPFSPIYHLAEKIVALEPIENNNGHIWKVVSDKNTIVLTKSIIIAAGVGAFEPNKPSLKNAEHFEKTHIHYSVSSRNIYKNKRLVIAGGGDSAIDWTISLAEITKHITLVHRREKFRAAPNNIDKINGLVKIGKVSLATPYQIHQIHGESEKLSYISLKNFKDASLHNVPLDYLLLFFGLSMNLGPIKDWGLSIDKNNIIIDPKTSATNKKGIYAVGDIATYDKKLKLILTGFSEAAQAAHAIREQIFPNQTFHFQYSTTQGIP